MTRDKASPDTGHGKWLGQSADISLVSFWENLEARNKDDDEQMG